MDAGSMVRGLASTAGSAFLRWVDGRRVDGRRLEVGRDVLGVRRTGTGEVRLRDVSCVR